MRIIFCILTLLLAGCANRGVDLDRVLGLWVDMELVEKVKSFDAPIKLVIYYSEEECVLCSLSKLDDWLRFNGIQEDESFILCPIVAPLAEDMLEEQRLEVAAYNSNKSNTYHVIVDYDNKFYETNAKILQNKDFHCFLLDANNEIVMVGNPITNDAIWKLFNQVLDNMLKNGGIYRENMDANL